ncbi:hypothetical protein U9M48_042097, partial [Paspalum notatum var. saurae]
PSRSVGLSRYLPFLDLAAAAAAAAPPSVAHALEQSRAPSERSAVSAPAAGRCHHGSRRHASHVTLRPPSHAPSPRLARAAAASTHWESALAEGRGRAEERGPARARPGAGAIARGRATEGEGAPPSQPPHTRAVPALAPPTPCDPAAAPPTLR